MLLISIQGKWTKKLKKLGKKWNFINMKNIKWVEKKRNWKYL